MKHIYWIIGKILCKIHRNVPAQMKFRKNIANTVSTIAHTFQEMTFDAFIYLSYILITASYFGVFASAPQYLDELDYYVRIYVCLFLIWRFNPLRTRYTFTALDRKIAFSAGLFILTTTALHSIIMNVVSKFV